MSSLQFLVQNLTAAKPRYETLDGKQYAVVPMTMIVPGVLRGSKGPLLYPPEEVGKDPTPWNGMPITYYHPRRNGKNVSARDPEVLEAQGLGFVARARTDGALKAESWIDIEKANKLDKRILENVEKGLPVEISTGLFTDNSPAEEGSHYNGKSYSFVARNYRPDHLAILIDQKGACSLDDGCGLGINKMETNDFSPEARQAAIEERERNAKANPLKEMMQQRRELLKQRAASVKEQIAQKKQERISDRASKASVMAKKLGEKTKDPKRQAKLHENAANAHKKASEMLAGTKEGLHHQKKYEEHKAQAAKLSLNMEIVIDNGGPGSGPHRRASSLSHKANYATKFAIDVGSRKLVSHAAKLHKQAAVAHLSIGNKEKHDSHMEEHTSLRKLAPTMAHNSSDLGANSNPEGINQYTKHGLAAVGSAAHASSMNQKGKLSKEADSALRATNDASVKSYVASHGKGSASDHINASAAHMKASQLHSNLFVAHTTASVQKGADTKLHQAIAKSHREASQHHNEAMSAHNKAALKSHNDSGSFLGNEEMPLALNAMEIKDHEKSALRLSKHADELSKASESYEDSPLKAHSEAALKAAKGKEHDDAGEHHLKAAKEHMSEIEKGDKDEIETHLEAAEAHHNAAAKHYDVGRLKSEPDVAEEEDTGLELDTDEDGDEPGIHNELEINSYSDYKTGTQECKMHSERANEASELAEKTNRQKDHHRAANAHEEAASSWMSHEDGAKTDKAAEHGNKAEEHRAKSGMPAYNERTNDSEVDGQVGTSHNPPRKETPMAKLTANQRTAIIDKLTGNESCGCFGKDDKTMLQGFSDEKLTVLAQKLEGEVIGNSEEQPSGKQQTEAEWLANAPPSVREAVTNAQQITQNEKNNIIAKLTANVAEADKKTMTDFLGKKSLDELRVMQKLTANNALVPQVRVPIYGPTSHATPVDVVNTKDTDVQEMTGVFNQWDWAGISKENRQKAAAN